MFLSNEGAWEGVFPQSALGYAQCLHHTAWVSGRILVVLLWWCWLFVEGYFAFTGPPAGFWSVRKLY